MTTGIDHPSHYSPGTYEYYKVSLAWELNNPFLWTVGKYLSRAGKKEGESLDKDLNKMKWYLDTLILLRAIGASQLPNLSSDTELEDRIKHLQNYDPLGWDQLETSDEIHIKFRFKKHT